MDSAPARPPITESFWFWVCLFATMGLVALWAIGQKYDARQTQVEQKAQGRLRAAEQAAGGEMTTEVSSRGDLEISLRPLYALLGGVVMIGWAILWWHYFRSASQDEATHDSETASED